MGQFLPVPQVPLRQVVEGQEPSGPSWGGAGQSQSSEGMSLVTLIGMMRRHWLLMSSTVVITMLGAFGVTRITTPTFRATTTLYFAQRPSSIPALDVLTELDNDNSEVATEMEVMRSRALAEAVVDSLGLQVGVAAPKAAITSRYLQVLSADPAAPDQSFEFSLRPDRSFQIRNAETDSVVGFAFIGQPVTFGSVLVRLNSTAAASNKFAVRVRPRHDAVDDLTTELKITRPNPSASVVQVAYTGPDPERTRRIPDMLATTYLAWRTSTRKAGDRSTVEFLREQIDTISRQLYAAEEGLKRFRESNQVVDLPTQAQSEVQRLASLEAQRSDIDMQRSSLTSLMSAVKSSPSDRHLGSPYRRLMAFTGLMTSSNPAFPLLQTLTDLEQRRSDLLVRRTENDPDVAALSLAISGIESQIAAVVETYLKGLDEQAKSLSAGISKFRVTVDEVPQKEVAYARLERTESGLNQIYTMLQTRLREAQIAEAVDDAAVRVVDPASLPTTPIAPRLSTNLILGFLLGAVLAIVGVLLRERLDRTVHTKEDAELISGAAVLAMIPHIGEAARARHFEQLLRWRQNGLRKPHVAATNRLNENRLLLDDPQSVAAEAFRKLRTNITFVRPGAPPKVLVFTSPAPGDGKSTSVMNLAIALVQQGKKVLVVDADMRRGGLHRMLNGRQAPGLSEVLVGQAEFETAVQSLEFHPFGATDILATGVVPPNPAELLAAPRFAALIEMLRPQYDAILIDSPPINLVTDAAIIGRGTDGAVLVVRAAKTTGGEIAHAVGQLRQVQVAVTGVVLNDYNARRDANYHNPYYYGYAYDYRPYAGQA